MNCPTNYVKSEPIPIKNNHSIEPSLRQNLFDPTKSSPPNEFLNKLRFRMDTYYMKSVVPVNLKV
jgi:hypothetical protein